MAEENAFDLLGVTPKDDVKTVRRAFRRLARVHHPDRHPPERRAEEERVFMAITWAYEVLSNPDKWNERDQEYRKYREAREEARRARAQPVRPRRSAPAQRVSRAGGGPSWSETVAASKPAEPVKPRIKKRRKRPKWRGKPMTREEKIKYARAALKYAEMQARREAGEAEPPPRSPSAARKGGEKPPTKEAKPPRPYPPRKKTRPTPKPKPEPRPRPEATPAREAKPKPRPKPKPKSKPKPKPKPEPAPKPTTGKAAPPKRRPAAPRRSLLRPVALAALLLAGFGGAAVYLKPPPPVGAPVPTRALPPPPTRRTAPAPTVQLTPAVPGRPLLAGELPPAPGRWDAAAVCGRRLVLADGSGRIRLRTLEQAGIGILLPDAAGTRVRALAGGAEALVVLRRGGQVELRELPSGRRRWTRSSGLRRPDRLLVTRDGTRVIVAAGDRVAVLRARDGRRLGERRLPRLGEKGPRCLEPDGATVAAVIGQELFRRRTGEIEIDQRHRLPADVTAVRHLIRVAGTTRYALASSDGTLRLVDLITRRTRTLRRGDGRALRRLGVSRNGRVVLALDADGAGTLWEL